jgi:hypothetical protein
VPVILVRVSKHSDKRKHLRHDATPLHVKLKVDGRVHPEAIVENVSLGGCMVMLSEPCALGKNVLLELRDSKRTVRLVGRVIATVPKGKDRELPAMRLRFQQVSEQLRSELSALLDALTSGEGFRGRDLSGYRFPGETGEFRPVQPDTLDVDIEEQAPVSAAKMQAHDAPTRIVSLDEIQKHVAKTKRKTGSHPRLVVKPR